MERRVLIVDDDATVRLALRDALGTAGFVVDVADGAISALAMIGARKPGIVVSDVRMPDFGGLELLRDTSVVGRPIDREGCAVLAAMSKRETCGITEARRRAVEELGGEREGADRLRADARHA